VEAAVHKYNICLMHFIAYLRHFIGAQTALAQTLPKNIKCIYYMLLSDNTTVIPCHIYSASCTKWLWVLVLLWKVNQNTVIHAKKFLYQLNQYPDITNLAAGCQVFDKKLKPIIVYNY